MNSVRAKTGFNLVFSLSHVISSEKLNIFVFYKINFIFLRMVEGGGYESYAEDWAKAESRPPNFDMDKLGCPWEILINDIL